MASMVSDRRQAIIVARAWLSFDEYRFDYRAKRLHANSSFRLGILKYHRHNGKYVI